MAERVKAIVTAAGLSTRMGMNQPKALLLVNERTLIEGVLERFDGCDVVVVVGFGGDKIRSYLSAIGRDVAYAEQIEANGEGHAIRCAREFVGRDKFWTSVCDHVIKLPNVDPNENTVGVKMVHDFTGFGVVDVYGRKVIGLGKRAELAEMKFVFTGVAFFGDPEYAWSKIERHDEFDDALDEMACEGRLVWAEMPFWVSIGTHEEYERYVSAEASSSCSMFWQKQGG